MTRLDDRIVQAVAELRDEVDALNAPPFSRRRSVVPVMLLLVLFVGVGVGALAVRSRAGDSGAIAVTTQTDQSEVVVPELDTTEDAESVASPLIGQLTAAEPGEFLMPLPAGTAWSNDESLLLMYRTGAADPGHFVVESATGRVVQDLPFVPADIEQVYWHPTSNDLLVYMSQADVLVYDLATAVSTVIRTFEQCDRVDSGVLPVAPAADGTLSMLCYAEAGAEQIVYNLETDQVQQAPTLSDTAAAPSPSGRILVRSNPDGSVSVLDPDLVETGVKFDLGGNLFVFVTDNTGREWIASTLFDGPAVGSLVVFPVDGADPATVVIGPEQGDVYPPSGTGLAGAGGVIAVAIKGQDDGALAGQIITVDLGDVLVGESSTPVERLSFPHQSGGAHDYWSTPFLSLSPSGRFVAYATDLGGDRVETIIAVTRSGTD